ncbi:MAG: DUF1622 domain-containing protein [Elainellaceae cyanobacterium]
MEWIELLKTALVSVVELLRFVLETISALCIFLGLVAVIRLGIAHPHQFRSFQFLNLRLRLGSWWALALEFQLGADILSTTVAPSFTELGKLGAIALIRTFLNFFLNKELEDEANRLNQNRPPQA